MRRIAVGIAGAIYGFLLMLACQYAVDAALRSSHTGPAGGCHELGKCPMSWQDETMIILIVFGPAVVFAVLNLVAWRRWTLQRWLTRFGLATILIIGLNSILAV